MTRTGITYIASSASSPVSGKPGRFDRIAFVSVELMHASVTHIYAAAAGCAPG